jgi:excisionase family DNA binding protein
VLITPDVLTTSQVARRLDISRQHTIRLASAGRIACIRTPLGRLFPVAEVERVAFERSRVTA